METIYSTGTSMDIYLIKPVTSQNKLLFTVLTMSSVSGARGKVKLFLYFTDKALRHKDVSGERMFSSTPS
jgi:hypothetical protein